jgi:3-oxoacyl-[acyl-carrier-protein] synthase-1
MTRILITATGAVCGAGRTPDEILATIGAGRSAIAPITLWDTSGWPCRVAAEIPDFSARAMVEDRKLHKLIRRSDLVGLYAAGQAIAASGVIDHRATLDDAAAATFSDRSGVYVGSGGGSYENTYDFLPLIDAAAGSLPEFGRKLGETVNPMWLLRTLPNNVLGHIGIRYALKGPNACITNHSVGGILAVIEATEALRSGEADRAIAAGHDTPIEPQMVLYYHRLGVLARETLRPFDAARDGSLFGEGAAAFALETDASAQARNAPVIGEVLGGAYACEAEGLTAIRADGDGVARAIELALADANVDRSEVGMIVAHGNGTRLSDASEAAALRRVFGDAMPPVTAFKWSIGHLIASAGIVEATVALAALRAREVPGIPTLGQLDPACAPLSVSRESRAPRSPVALVVSRGFAGTNAALLIRAR